jgi:hypothetical protein
MGGPALIYSESGATNFARNAQQTQQKHRRTRKIQKPKFQHSLSVVVSDSLSFSLHFLSLSISPDHNNHRHSDYNNTWHNNSLQQQLQQTPPPSSSPIIIIIIIIIMFRGERASVIEEVDEESGSFDASTGHASSSQAFSTTNNRSNNKGGTPDAHSLAGQETRWVKYSKGLVYFVLFLAACAGAFCTHRFSVRGETQRFKIQVGVTV